MGSNPAGRAKNTMKGPGKPGPFFILGVPLQEPHRREAAGRAIVAPEYNGSMICDSQEPELEAFLTRHGIEATRHEHAPVMTVAESERLVPPLPGAKTKNLFLRDKKGARHFLVTVPYDLAVDLDALALQLGAGRLGFASADRLMKHLGVTPGSVSMLALVNDAANAVELVVDRRLWEAEAVHAHPLVNTATMVIPHGELERFLAATGHSPRVAEVPGRSS